MHSYALSISMWIGAYIVAPDRRSRFLSSRLSYPFNGNLGYEMPLPTLKYRLPGWSLFSFEFTESCIWFSAAEESSWRDRFHVSGRGSTFIATATLTLIDFGSAPQSRVS